MTPSFIIFILDIYTTIYIFDIKLDMRPRSAGYKQKKGGSPILDSHTRLGIAIFHQGDLQLIRVEDIGPIGISFTIHIPNVLGVQ